MQSDYERRLAHELAAAGITGALRRRILAEIGDHLASDHEARLGDPRALARQFADELGTERALAAARDGFAGLSIAGVLFAVAFVTAGSGAFGVTPKGAPGVARIATGLAILAPQVAFVGGMLALLRWWRRRGAVVVPAAEARIIVRRAGLGVGAGVVTMVSLGAVGLLYRPYVSHTWSSVAVAASAVGTVGLLVAARFVWQALRLLPLGPGGAGDIFTDLGALAPRPLRGRPWVLAGVVAGGVALAITLAGVAASDGYDGALRGIVDGLLCLAGFATLGRWLGLWTSGPATGASSGTRQQTQAQ